MSLQRAKPIDRLYDECRGYDLVLVPDPPMRSALNRRVEDPRFGPFAITPRRLAAGDRERADERLAFHAVTSETDLTWKGAAYLIENVLNCWDTDGELEAILDYAGFDTADAETVVSCLRDLDFTANRLADYRIPDETDVAVVGIEEFSTLERSILPSEYESIDPFTDEPFDLPPFRIFDSPAAIVDTILDTVTADNADRVAIVLERDSEYSALVESALEAADIPFYGGPGFTDHPDHRTFLRLLRVCQAGSDIRIADVRPILESMGATVPIDHDPKRLAAVDLPAVTRLRELCADIADHSFGAAVDTFETLAGVDIGAFHDELGHLGLLGDPVTDRTVNQLEFYLRTYDVPVERHNEGVLLADAKAAGTVDRPAVFYLGLDEPWTHSTPRRPWVDREDAFTRQIHQFQRLLQNGVARYYLVLDERGGRAVTPCLYFDELLEADFERFTDLDSTPQARSYQTAGDGFSHDPLDVESESIETISQSGLNRLVNCPRDHLFADLVDNPDRDYFVVGNLFHDFAEVYANHPDRVDGTAIDTVVDTMVDATRPFDRAIDEATNRTRYRIGLETIMRFLDANPPEGASFLTSGRGWWSNAVAEKLGLDVDTPHTEWWFEEPELGLKGKIDLVHSQTELLDYKSGRRASAHQVVTKSAVDPVHDEPTFQAVLYLAYLRSQVPDKPLEFTFFHFLVSLDDVVTGDAALDECLTTVTYYPVPFAEYITRVPVLQRLVEEAPGDCQKTFDQLPIDEYREVIADHPFPEGRTKDELLDSPLGGALYRQASAVVGDYAYVENGCAQALSFLADIRDSNYFADDLDAFETFVEERLTEINRYRSGTERYPVKGIGGEPNYRRVDNRDMIFEGDA